MLLLAAGSWLSVKTDSDKNSQLSDIDKNLIQQIRILRPNQNEIVFRKRNRHWFLSEPYEIAANQLRISSVLNLLDANSVQQYPLANLNPAEFGLKPAKATVYFDEHVFHFGSDEPIGGNRYLQVGEMLHLLADNHFPLVTAGVDTLIDRKLIPEIYDVAAYHLAEFTISETDSLGWQIDPADPKLNANNLQHWVDQWRSAEAIDVALTQQPNNQDGRKITVALNNDETIYFDIIQRDQWQGLFRADRKLAYGLSKQTLKALLDKPSPNN